MATVTYSVFPIRKFYTEKMFFLLRMDILRLSEQSSKWVCTFHDGCKQGIYQQIFSSKWITNFVNY